MADYTAIYAVGNSLVQFLNNSFPANLKQQYSNPKFELVSSSQIATEDTTNLVNVVSLFLHRIWRHYFPMGRGLVGCANMGEYRRYSTASDFIERQPPSCSAYRMRGGSYAPISAGRSAAATATPPAG